MKLEKTNKIWSYIVNNCDWKLERKFDITIVDIDSNGDECVDNLDQKGNEYTLYKEDIEKYANDFYDFEEEYDEKHDNLEHGYTLESYILEKMIENINVKLFEEADEDVQQHIREKLQSLQG